MEEYNPRPNVGINVFIIVSGIVIGFFMGWIANTNSEYNLVCIFIAIILMIALKRAKEMYVSNIIDHSELTREHRKEEEELMSKQLSLVKEQAALQIEHPFTSENFDRDAQELLLSIIETSKKSKRKTVSGAMLVSELLKSIR